MNFLGLFGFELLEVDGISQPSNTSSLSSGRLTIFCEEKICFPERNLFVGHIDAVTGDLVDGKLIAREKQEVYEGPFENGKRHGSGATLVMGGGNVKFIGSFHYNRFSKGTLITPSFTYTGEFDCGKGSNLYNGYGSIAYRNGSSYVGEWTNGFKSGIGTEVLSEYQDMMFRGNFKRGTRNGLGVLRAKNSIFVIGCWENGKLMDNEKWIIVYSEKAATYMGSVKHLRPHGKGVMTIKLPDGNLLVLVGTFCHSVFVSGEEAVVNPSEESSTSVDDGIIIRSQLALSIAKEARDEMDMLYDTLSGIWHEIFQHRESAMPSVTSSSRTESSEGNASGGEQIRTKGRIAEPYRNVYDGTLMGSARHGEGTLTCILLCTEIRGSFRTNLLHGRAAIKMIDGSTYDGEFIEGTMCGAGIFHDTIFGFEYRGKVKDGVRHGFGTSLEGSGTREKYCGHYRYGKRHGQGELYEEATESKESLELVYKGEWMNDRMEGSGCRYNLTETGVEGGDYDGSFVAGKREGIGSFVSKSGSDTYIGHWKNDKPLPGKWIIKTNKGVVVYKGEAKLDSNSGLPVPSGQGTEKKKGEVYVGNFRRGLRHGTGLCFYTNGERWEGRWHDGIFQKYGRAAPSSAAPRNQGVPLLRKQSLRAIKASLTSDNGLCKERDGYTS